MQGVIPDAARSGDRAGTAGSGVVAVVVTYESGDALSACVAALVAEGVAPVVVVDNGSLDGSVGRMREAAIGGGYASTVVIEAPGVNLGYGAAANRGVAATISDHVLVCNADVEVHPGAIRELVDALDADPRMAMVGPMIRTRSGDRYPSARAFPSLVDAAGHALFGMFRPGNRFTQRYQMGSALPGASGTVPVDWLSGACFLVRRSAFEEVGGFDEAYFMYAEDVDLCWRLGRSGYRVGYCPAAEVTHLQGVSTAHHRYRMLVEHHRSLLRFASRSTTGPARLLLPFIALGIGTRFLLSLVRTSLDSRPGRARHPAARL
jgi:N-acetylglucosaminyl-diphospho-decaprenol L-rhamnosyltransferase